MYAAKRQIRIWKHEISEAWDKTSFYGRLFLGALISFAIALTVAKTVLQPMNEEISELSSDLEVPEELDSEKDETVIMYTDRAEKLQESLKAWEERVDKLKTETKELRPESHLEVIRAFQNVYERCQLTLVSETMKDPCAVEEQKTSGRKKGKKEPETEKPKSPLCQFTHYYEVRGNFRQIQAMLLLAGQLPWRFSIHDISLCADETSHSLLNMKFTLDIDYLSDGA